MESAGRVGRPHHVSFCRNERGKWAEVWADYPEDYQERSKRLCDLNLAGDVQTVAGVTRDFTQRRH